MTHPVPRRVAALLAASLLSAIAQAQTLPPPVNVVSLAASASVELPMDWLSVTFSTSREGPEASVLQSQLKQALDAALAEARRAARPGEVQVRTGPFSLQPRYAVRGQPSGWVGHAELTVEGRDIGAITQLAGRIQTLTVARVHWSLSREAREKVEGELTAQAIARFRAKADAVAAQFGFGGWSLREVNVASGGEPPVRPMPVLRGQALAAAAAEPLPAEAGSALVSASVNGSVVLTK
jgi:predicted secreted protein